MEHTWEDLAGLSLAHPFPEHAGDVPGMSRGSAGALPYRASPFRGLAACFLGVNREAVASTYDAGSIVRRSTIRGTVHTNTP